MTGGYGYGLTGGIVGGCDAGDCCKAGDTTGVGWVKLPAGGAASQQINTIGGGGSVLVSNGKLSTGVESLSCCEKNKTSTFYEYEIKVYDLSYSEVRNDNRVVYSKTGGIELADGLMLRDSVILRHAPDLAKFSDTPDRTIRVDTKQAYSVSPKP